MARRWVRTREELLVALEHQKQAIQASCEGFDQGNEWEAMRLATCVYTLVHDGSEKTRSILTQLRVRESTQFISYVPSNQDIISRNLLRENPLVMARVRVDETGKTDVNYLPVLNNGPISQNHVRFPAWWEDESIIRDPDTLWLNRKRLVSALRNQDGGSHLGEKVTDPAYIKFSRGSGSLRISDRGIVSGPNTSDKDGPDVKGVHLATMRHIAWELLETINTLFL